MPDMTAPARDATLDDVRAITCLWQDCGLTVPWNDPASDLALSLSKPDSTVLVHEQDRRIIATVMVGHDGHRGWLYYLAVSPDMQGTGLGRSMVQAAETWLAARGLPKVQLMVRATNEKVVGFYQSLGYATSPVIVMQKWLISPPS